MYANWKYPRWRISRQLYVQQKKIKVCKVQSRAKQEKSLIFQHCKAIVGSYTVIILWKIQTKFVTIQTKAA